MHENAHYRNLIEKLRAKLPATTHGYSMVKFTCLYDACSEFFELEASPVARRSITAAKI